ncbi:hypothetical protein H2274_07080 [Campylobacter sp. W0049]|uniref:hypothetical protein n=1 Tax=Campylobacter molothri TaxID=1032242 RepID=UPI00301C146F|nr:hypothetical protein [Campylobacter sp. W0049]
MTENSNFQIIKERIENQKLKRKEEDKKNKKIIEQIKIISNLRKKLEKEEEKLNILVDLNQNQEIKENKKEEEIKE